MRCVVCGATGYIGGRLVPELLAAGHEVRAVAKSIGPFHAVIFGGMARNITGAAENQEVSAS
jgi:uncharacterized protein YbjT (DUF2867 family)